ncbi:quinoprotein dehydrogenase-associated SoxYZ-like carrier [Methylobacterium brachythecii]|uniref:Sulfur-oxidizing protein SoxY n=1 Tax=Methylobacterium brachythecii TaxID=1176177 RepID=A0A7W6F4Y9_9HYPH|nr:quinoprotein dehydrogenase-associated SoxYZ-like carrier [Methylobacterium brachythecii]MBB3900875.1 sulfur-oxidizing protein SoxY [Methylobacterium brachythecii]GLS46440.1 hypothetical protein GCM10007884_44340 [Methylobacterium brachythecii]
MMVPFRKSPSPATAVAAETTTRDPLDSPMWNDLSKRYLSGRTVVFDDRVQVILPPVTENQTQVPITIDARALGQVDEILVIVDLHPFPQPLRMEPIAAQPFVVYRQKIEQGTPVRAAARQGDTWYVGGRYLDAAGGGCSVPPAVIAKIDWEHVGEIRARAWREADGGARVRMRLLHPMDNGMIANIPAFFIETLNVTDASGAPLAKLQLSEAIAANPTLTLLPEIPKDGQVLKVAARDNNGGDFKATVPIPAAAPRMREGRL